MTDLSPPPLPLDAAAAFAMGNLLALLRLASHGLRPVPRPTPSGDFGRER